MLFFLPILKNIRFRTQALRQIVPDARDDRNTVRERAASVIDRLQAAVTGHLSPMASSIIDWEAIRLIDDRIDITPETVRLAFLQGYISFVDIGPRRSGFTIGFLDAQHEHYASCERCREKLRKDVIRQWEMMKSTSALIDLLKVTDPEGLETLRRKTTDRYLRMH